MSTAGFGRAIRLLAIVGLVGFGCLFGAGAAQAGGPTSVLLVSPSQQRATALYYSDPEYDQLFNLLDGADPGPNSAGATSPPTGISGEYVTVTWLIHDVSIWRVDRIMLPLGDGEPWIVTEQSAGGPLSLDGMYPGEAGNDTAVWHLSPDPEALTGLLAGLGLTGTVVRPLAGSPAAETVAAEPVLASVAPQAVNSETNQVDSAARAAGPWWWLIGGLCAGVFLTGVAVRYLPVVRRSIGGDHDAGADPAARAEPERMMQLPTEISR